MGTKLKYVTKVSGNPYKSEWERKQIQQGHQNPHLFLNPTIVNNPWNTIKQKEESILAQHIPGLYKGQNAKFKNKREQNDALRNDRILQTKSLFDQFKFQNSNKLI